jgi:hypothetical protein
MLADWVGDYYQDDIIFADNYDGLAFHMESLITQAKADHEDGLLAFSRYSDWCPPAGCVACRGKCPVDGKCSVEPHNSALVSSFYCKSMERTPTGSAFSVPFRFRYNGTTLAASPAQPKPAQAPHCTGLHV